MIITHPISRSLYKLRSLLIPSPEIFKPRENDVYLVSYPRSGNTWMRVIMAELVYGKSGESIEDIQYYVPDIHRKTYAKDVINSEFNLIKSHHLYRRDHKEVKTYKKIIYIIRDPRDVVVSYYKYLKNLRGYPLGFDEFILNWISGRIWPCSWQEHINSWIGLGNQNSGIELEILRYEDLLVNPEPELLKLGKILGIQITSEDVQRAIQAAAVDKMRAKESKGMPEHERSDKFQFIGEATTKQWSKKLTSDQLNLITEYLGATMKRHGYI
ncbi:sulfotransferase domain-containing protein [Anabaena sp. UHCC 0187]|uniref:sulfotransferase domain-containing protein n=1 Tax=Anabaena sp. UHCC 0187 TaxID=2590018 RepID=UPI001445C631|nr:sulfotransferase domain-containing protein [Anabaena sp. UHCC 0187]MTJ11409.1 sulfotransferase domain-containing protein [Anabaena sp. UHCC 0187]